MEFIIVEIKGQPNADAGVLINGQRNGTTGSLITLGGPGWMSISVDVPGAEEQKVEVTNTTAGHPMRVEIQVVARQSKAMAAKGSRSKVARKKAPEKTEAILREDDFSAGPAGYTSEFCGVGGNRPVADYLDVEVMANQLAELIALRETRLPLAIGLFGNWGSGKSHFMNLIDRKLKKLAKGTPEEGPWCREIVPIYFNAWHYLDMNLWASLVTEIFDGLSAYLKPKQDELAVMQSRLREAGGATARAHEEATHAHEAVGKASAALQEARAHSRGARAAIRGLMDSLRTLLPHMNTPENQQRLAEWLGVSAEEEVTLSQLAAKHREMVSFSGRVQELWRRATAREGLAGRLGWFLGALIVVPGLAWLAAALMPRVAAWLKSIGPDLKIALTALAGVAAWMKPVFAEFWRRLRQIETLQDQAEKAQAARPQDEKVIAAQEKVVQAEAAATAAEADLAVAHAMEQQLTQAVDDLRPEQRLGRFIDSRARSADYRGQLGLVSLARRDFQELSDIFTDAESLQEKAQQQFNEETEELKKLDDSADRIKEATKLFKEKTEQLEKLGASVDRIVLFVDDLDRCQPEKVADVLQAVHLLLAYPLFAVVVGVDQRCLKQSIVKQFRGLMSPGDDAQDGRSATPLDYLEKIFHVPFHLPLMGKEGFATLIDKLTESTPSAAIAFEISPTKLPTNSSPPEPPKIAPVIGSVPLKLWERVALKDYHPLLCTPRGATRLLNTYRLVRAGIPAEEWTYFRGDGIKNGEFRVAMLLLAAAAGFPALARQWFTKLRNADPTALFFDDSEQPASKEWMQFKMVYDATFAQTTPQPTKELFAKWLDRVERFAF